MARPTADLVRQLAANSAAVQPLPRPWLRTAAWLVVCLLYLVLLDVAWPHEAPYKPIDGRFVVEQIAALATGVAAAIAAFASIVPGYSRRLALASFLPLALWLVVLGQSCAREWSSSLLPPMLSHWGCFPATIIAGLVPAMAMLVMLRRGAPIAPRLTTALAGLAVASLANVGIRFVHPFDASLIVLAWHVVAMFGVIGLATIFGNRLFTWRDVTDHV
jgi:hypothetical protein